MKAGNYLRLLLVLVITTTFSISIITAQTAIPKPQHYVGIKNTGNNMTVGIPAFAWKTLPSPGDEIGAFDPSGRLIGATVFTGGNSALSIWGNDETTKNKDGVETGRKVEFRLWHKSDNSVDVIVVTSWLEGDDIYKVDGISVVNELELKALTIADGKNLLEQNVPNPANTVTNIKFNIVTSTHVKLVLFTTDGKLVREFLSENLEVGEHDVDLNVSDLAVGNYYYKMITPDFTDTKYLNIIR